ncbi:deoxynucleoside monophosphate kinase [Bacillus phage Thurquoise]|nr:deoxynucleoside monophosphate kinase [Bacillus phage Thurquoise]
MKEIKIAIAGEFRSGKSTVAEYLDEKYSMLQFAFADELKRDFHKEYPDILTVPKPRKGYQLYGQLMRYVYGEDYWINRCFNKIENIRQAAMGYNITGSEAKFNPVITDLRQHNELERCREEGYHIIKVLAPKSVRVQRAKEEGDSFSEEELQHETEVYVREMDTDFTIMNNGTIEDLYAEVDYIMSVINPGTVASQIQSFYNVRRSK